jgi:hypothetical protein
MTRPVRPIALVILTACMLYPGLGFLYQGLYPFWAGEYFNLVGQQGPWMDWALKLGVPQVAVSLLKAGLGLTRFAGVRRHGDGGAGAHLPDLLPRGPRERPRLRLPCSWTIRKNSR